MRTKLFLLSFIVSITLSITTFSQINNSIPISAPITVDSPGKMSTIAAKSVMRIICTKTNMGGTGFLHESGWVITAAHVVDGCLKNDLMIITSDGQRLKIDSVISDKHLDLAVLKPTHKINSPSLELSIKTEIITGTMVTTWGFPAGYSNLTPLLTVEYLAGIDHLMSTTGVSPARWVVNAAFNGGNSGGPVLDIESGEVIGVVSSKLAPIPEIIESALNALSNQRSGFTYTKTLGNGTTETVSEGQVISEVLKYLRNQTQLVLGHAVTSNDLINFLKTNKIIN
jgi:S1-C subfamily serine protease